MGPRRRLRGAWVGGALLVIIGIAVWFAWPSSPPAPPLQGAGGAVAQPAGVAEATADASAVPAREAIAVAPPLAAVEVSPETSRIFGRCVTKEDHGGIPGCSATFTRAYRTGEDSEPSDRQTIGVTDSAGRFELFVTPRSGYPYTLDLRGPGRVPRKGSWESVGPGSQIDVGDVELEPGQVVTGLAVDRQDRPVAALVLRLHGPPALPFRGSGTGGATDARTTTAADGRFVFDQAILPGEWRLDTITTGIGVAEPKLVTVPFEGELHVVVVRFGSVRGIAVDQTGAPAAGALLYARIPGSGEAVGAARVAKDGGFEVFANREGLQEIDVVPNDDRFTTEGEVPRGRVGEQNLRVVLRRAPELEILVIETDTREPVLDYSIYHAREGHTSSADLGRRRLFEGGRGTVEGLTPGRHLLRIIPADQDLAVSEPLVLEVDSGPLTPRTIELQRRIAREVHVTDAHGAPVAGSRLILEAHCTAKNRLSALDPRAGFTGYDDEWKARRPELCDTATTGVDGTATVHAARGARELLLRVEGDGHLPVAIPDLAFDVDALPIDVQVSRGGAMRGQVHLRDLDSDRVKLYPTPIGIVLTRNPQPFDLDTGGGFHIEALQPATYELRVGIVVPMQRRGGGGSHVIRLPEVFATAVVRDGETATVDLDLGALAPGRARGRVSLEGVASGDLTVSLTSTGPMQATFGAFDVAPDGNWSADSLLPGTYLLSVSVTAGGDDGDLRIVDGSPLVISSGIEAVRDCHFAHRVLRGRLVDGDGKPLVERLLVFESAALRASLCYRRTDADGRFVLDPGPIGPCTISCARLTLEPAALDFPNLSGDQTVELRAHPR